MAKAKLSKRMLKEIDRAGLPAPDLGMSEAEFARLQKQWYAKAAKSGFEDIEWVDHRTGKGHDSSFLRGSVVGGKAYNEGRELYFQLASNYLEHCKGLRNRPYHKFIWRLHTEGLTYDEIEAAIKKKYRNSVSKYTLYYQIQELAKLCYVWNATSSEGLLVKRAEEKADVEEKGLEEFYKVEYNWLVNKEFAMQKVKRGR